MLFDSLIFLVVAMPFFAVLGVVVGLVVGVNIHLQFGKRAVGPREPE